MTQIPKDKLLEMYAMLQLVRKVELKIEEHYHEDEMKTPVHLALGQEAVAVGVCAHLRREDYIFSNHRSHAHYLAKGGGVKGLMAELYCKETGCSKGRGGSMHLIDKAVGHLGSSSMVGGAIPHAVGAAFAIKMQKKDLVAVSFFGDAASEQGVFYESMSWAKMNDLPVIFICENNHYSVYSHIHVRQPPSDIALRPKAFDIHSRKIDGMNVVEVYENVAEAMDHARSGRGPYFLECVVQRWRDHAGAGDPRREFYRTPAEQDESFWRDPIKDFREQLLKDGVIEEKEFNDIDHKVDQDIAEAFTFAKESPLPNPADLEKYLFS